MMLRKSRGNLFTVIVLAIMISIFMFSCTTEDVKIKNNTTDSDGKVIFTDSSTGEEVIVTVKDSTGKSVGGTNVQFFDSNKFEMFIVEDPAEAYSPCLRV